MGGVLLLPSEPVESEGNWLSGKGLGGVLAREGLLGLVVVSGTIWRLGAASAPSGPPLASSHTINNTLAANRWPWP